MMSAALEVCDVEGTVSVYFRTLTPKAASTSSPAIHHRQAPSVRTPMRSAVLTAWRHVDSRRTTTA
jgi:hypothetical protein